MTKTATTSADASSVLSVHESVALSMHADGAGEQAIRAATGLSERELSDLIADKALELPRITDSLTLAIDVPVAPLPGSDSLQELIEWAAAHPAASVRKHATRITAALTELSARRESEATQREAEDRVTEARAALEKAERELRAVKTGPAVRPPSRPPRSTPASAVPAAGTSSPRSRPGRASTVTRLPTGACRARRSWTRTRPPTRLPRPGAG
ncbi:hypothetical protein ACH4GC_40315 [Streptomyces zaomyceticus]|uniref:hypothetical protein n=1 Tax=Streptomyces zaomyceticus TaxID=68286 RepID=UPI0037B6BDA1